MELRLDGGESEVSTGVAFFDHMLSQVARHGKLGLHLKCDGDLEIDQHHTVEDCGIALGKAVAEALGGKAGIARFGTAHAPLDEALSRVVVDLSGRSGLFFRADFSRLEIGGMESQLVREFFQGFCNSCGATVHVDLLEGDNAHHQAESIFKAFGLALRAAVAIADPQGGIPSTKGTI